MSRGATNRIPMALWNRMVHPLTRVPVAGVIWYQGESNAGQPEAYRTLFTDMISGWRAAWQQPELPFLWVQLAGFAGMPDHQDWPRPARRPERRARPPPHRQGAGLRHRRSRRHPPARQVDGRAPARARRPRPRLRRDRSRRTPALATAAIWPKAAPSAFSSITPKVASPRARGSRSAASSWPTRTVSGTKRAPGSTDRPSCS